MAEAVGATKRLLDIEFVRYVLTTAIGFALAIWGQSIFSARQDARVRQTVRDSLAMEIVANLEVLDSYEASFRTGIAEGGTYFRWPTGRLTRSMLAECLDPSVGRLLSRGEQRKVSLTYNQIGHLEDEMNEAHEMIRAGHGNLLHEYRRFTIQFFPVVAQNLVDFLVQTFGEQSEFSSSELMEIVESVLPYYSSGATHQRRMWTTSGVSATNPVRPEDGSVLAWRNDDPGRVPMGVHVIELIPKQTVQFSIEDPPSRLQELLDGRRHRAWVRVAQDRCLEFRRQQAERT